MELFGISKVLRQILFQVKKIYTLKGILIFFLFLALPEIVDAAWWAPWTWGTDLLENVAGNIAIWVTSVIISVLTLVPALIFFIISHLATWLIETTVNIPVLPYKVGTPAFVNIGWEFTRGLVNLVFVLIAVFIGLGTMLRLQGYRLQTTLASLIVVALLINFSGVLVALVVDIANLIMNVFIKLVAGVGNQVFQNIFFTGKAFVNTLVASTPGNAEGLLDILIAGIVYGAVMAILYLLASIAFLVLFLIFLLRTIILWVLVILAPLAFAAYILPSTRRFWNQWWTALIQWAFVGIPILFFLYLSLLIMNLGPATSLFPTPIAEPSTGPLVFISRGLGELLSLILAPFTAIVLLFLGFLISMSLAPRSAQVVAGLGTAAVAYGVVKAKFAGKRAARTAVAGETTGKLLEGAAGAQTTMGRFGKTRIGRVVTKPVLWAQRGAAREGLKRRARIAGDVDQEMRSKDLQDLVNAKDWRGLAAEYNKLGTTPERKVAIASHLAQQEGQTGLNLLGDKKDEAIRLAAERSPNKHLRDLIRDDPTIAFRKDVWRRQVRPEDNRTDRINMGRVLDELVEKGDEEDLAKIGGRDIETIIAAGEDDAAYELVARKVSMRKALMRLRPERIKDMAIEAFTDIDNPEVQEFLEEFVASKNIQAWAVVQENFGQEPIERLQETVEKMNKDGRLRRLNPTLITASQTSVLRHLIPTLYDYTDKDNPVEIRSTRAAKEYVAEGRAEARDKRRPGYEERKDLGEIEGRAIDYENQIQGLEIQITEMNGEITDKNGQLTQNSRSITRAQQERTGRINDPRVDPATDTQLLRLDDELVDLHEDQTRIQQEINDSQDELVKLQQDLDTAKEDLRDYEQFDLPGAQQREAAAEYEDDKRTEERRARQQILAIPQSVPIMRGRLPVIRNIPVIGDGTPGTIRGLAKQARADIKKIEQEASKLNRVYKEIEIHEDQILRSERDQASHKSSVADLNAKPTLSDEEKDLRDTLGDELTRLDDQIKKARDFIDLRKPDMQSLEDGISNLKENLEKNIRTPLEAYQAERKAQEAAKKEEKDLKKKFEDLNNP